MEMSWVSNSAAWALYESKLTVMNTRTKTMPMPATMTVAYTMKQSSLEVKLSRPFSHTWRARRHEWYDARKMKTDESTHARTLAAMYHTGRADDGGAVCPVNSPNIATAKKTETARLQR
jgi:hypothetical protein